MTERKGALALQCQNIASAWMCGEHKLALALISPVRRPHKRCMAVVAGTMRVLANQYGDDHAADFASAITKPFGGHL